MIDFDKLKLAHELAIKTEWLYFKTAFGTNFTRFELFDGDEYVAKFDSLDELIEKIEELTPTEKEHKVGDEVWVVNCLNKCEKVKIIGKVEWRVGVEFDDGTRRYSTIHDLHKTKADLIEAQIKHWESQRD